MRSGPQGPKRSWRRARSARGTAGTGPNTSRRAVMAIKPNGDERNFGADRERQREVSSENGRSARAVNGESAARGDVPAESGSVQRSRSNRGFASMDRSKQREIASK